MAHRGAWDDYLLEDVDPDCIIPPIYQCLLTRNKDLVSEAIRHYVRAKKAYHEEFPAFYFATVMCYPEGMAMLLDAGVRN